MSAPPPDDRAAFERRLGELRPKLHRYCARMTGSVIDGEDVVQEALVKALEAFAGTPPANADAWLFRIAHNAALDHLRRRARRDAALVDKDLDMIVDPVSLADQRQAAAASLRTFMRLPVAQRSSVILMDVLGYSLQEIGQVTDSTLPAVKAALHRGREKLREIAAEPDDAPQPVLAEADRARLADYVARFNARDFDRVRDMLAEDVRLDLVNRTHLEGRGEVSRYFTNYARNQTWESFQGLVEGRPAVLIRDPSLAPAPETYFVLLEWTKEQLAGIRDFRYASYVSDGADIVIVD